MPDEASEHYWRSGAEAIRSRTRNLYEQVFEHGPVRHLSVFVVGPIPLLVPLGSCLSDKVPLTLYQRHRDSESWKLRDKIPPDVARKALDTLGASIAPVIRSRSR